MFLPGNHIDYLVRKLNAGQITDLVVLFEKNSVRFKYQDDHGTHEYQIDDKQYVVISNGKNI